MKTDQTVQDYLRQVLAGEPDGDCPVRRTLEILNGKWRTHIIYELCKSPSAGLGS